MRPRVILLNRTDPIHPGCELTSRSLIALINKYGSLVSSHRTPATHANNQIAVDFSNADVLLINGEGTMHHHSAAAPRHAAAELHRHALLAKERGLRVALVNTILEEFDADISIYNYLAVRDGLSLAAAGRHPSPVLVPDMCFHHLIRLPPEPAGEIIVTDSILPEETARLRAFARERGHTFLEFKRITFQKTLEQFRRARLIVTGRYHGVVFSIMTSTPMFCLSSNSHKIEALVKDFSIPASHIRDLAGLPVDLPLPPISPRELAVLPDDIERSIRIALLGDAPAEPLHPQPAQHFRRLSRNLRRLMTPRPLHHMLQYPANFIRPLPANPAYQEVWWRRQPVGRLRPLPPLRDSDKRDAFIVASGPSIKNIDLRAIRGSATFAVNGSIAKFQEAGFPPDYYVVVDKDFVQTRFAQVRAALASGAKCFFPAHILQNICQQDPGVLTGSNVHLLEDIGQIFGRPKLTPEAFRASVAGDPDILLHPSVERDPAEIGFSADLTKGVFHAKTVTYASLQVAFYLGSPRIFFLGMDLGGGSAGSSNRFYETGPAARPSMIDHFYETHILPAMEIGREMAARKLRLIYNVSPASRLPETVFPKITFADAQQILSSEFTL